MKYTFSCTMDNAVLSVDAKNDAEAVNKLIVEGKKHVQKAHSNATPMSDAEWEKMIRSGWKKG